MIGRAAHGSARVAAAAATCSPKVRPTTREERSAGCQLVLNPSTLAITPGVPGPGQGQAPALTSAMRRAAVSATEARMTLSDTRFMPAFQAHRSRSAAGHPGTLALESQTDHGRLSRGHARRLRALTPAPHLLAWRVETKPFVRRNGRRSRQATTDGRGLLLRISFLVRGGPRYVSGLRRVHKPQPRFRRGGEADACRAGSAAHPWCRCTRASSAACWGHAT